MKELLNEILYECAPYTAEGHVATYIPELAKGDPSDFGICVMEKGGGILAVVPGRMGIGMYSPALDKKGNSVAAIKALEKLSRRMELSIF
ncbi:MAG: hypothetical protein E7644_08775 [Ruminococcaceae bacterium]|nr:hypothetical protein [Oscillospiraceae bacterium]